MSKRLGGIIGCKYKTSSCSPMEVTLGQQYNTAEKPTVMLHAGKPDIRSVLVCAALCHCYKTWNRMPIKKQARVPPEY